MIINKKSQLGLRFEDLTVKRDFLTALISVIDKSISDIKSGYVDADLLPDTDYAKIVNKVILSIGEVSCMDTEKGKHYLICDSVYKASELIKVSTGFTGRTLKDIKLGQHTYLMGKNRMVSLFVALKGIKGFYYDSEKNNAFEWYVDLEEGEYAFNKSFINEFTEIMKILTFVELGDIEVKILESGRNNGGFKNIDKITNQSNATVYVVDSSWNQIVIRTDGFAVRGHFRLQPCGVSNKDRKLIWIDAFEKDGYKRRATATIIR